MNNQIKIDDKGIHVPFDQSSPLQEFRVFCQILPREVSDVVRIPINHINETRRYNNNVLGYESLDDAIMEMQHLCFHLRVYVAPENFFFFACKTMQAVYEVLGRPFFLPSVSQSVFAPSEEGNDYQRHEEQEKQANPRAVIVFKFQKTKDFEHIVGSKQYCAEDETSGERDRCKMTWSEFSDFCRNFKD